MTPRILESLFTLLVLVGNTAPPTITSQPARSPSPLPRPAPTARALPPGLVA
jgi:hypothetical protein